MYSNKRGGSLAYNHVMGLLNKGCSKTNSHKSNNTKGSFKNMRLYKTTGGGRKQSKKSGKKSSKRKRRTNKKHKSHKGGGSDWLQVVRSRGPVNYGSTYDKNQFRKFTKTGKYYDNYLKLVKRGGAKSKKPSNQMNKKQKLSQSVKRLRKNVKNTPKRLAQSLENNVTNAATNITKSAERNLKQLNK